MILFLVNADKCLLVYKQIHHHKLYQLTSGFMLQASEEVTKNLVAMKTIMCGTEQHEPQSELVAQLAQEIYKSHIILLMLTNLSHIDFEVC